MTFPYWVNRFFLTEHREAPQSNDSTPPEGGNPPPFPFPLHVSREGEPPRPRLMSSATLQNSPEEQEARLNWHAWTEEQADFDLLFQEQTWFERWEYSRGQFTEKDLKRCRREIIAQGRKLREQGHGDLIDAYWLHLAPMEAEEEAKLRSYPLPLHIQREGEPPRPQLVSHEETYIGTQKAIDAGRSRKEWVQWAKQQPDATLLSLEYSFYIGWFISESSPELALDDDIEDYVREQQRLATIVRDAGYSNVIENYWSNVLRHHDE